MLLDDGVHLLSDHLDSRRSAVFPRTTMEIGYRSATTVRPFDDEDGLAATHDSRRTVLGGDVANTLRRRAIGPEDSPNNKSVVVGDDGAQSEQPVCEQSARGCEDRAEYALAG